MQWCDFYDAFWDWSDSTRRTRISSLEDIGSGEEVVDAVLEIEDPKVKAQLIRKAIKLGVEFTGEDIANLDGELPDPLCEQLGLRQRTDRVELQFKKALDNFATDKQIAQLEEDVDMLCRQLDQQFPQYASQESQRNQPAKGCLQNMLEFGIMSILFVILVIVCIMLLVASGD